ncbi:MAG: LON peptidase substrate-binding domain-containing protein [Maricaulaceae bacterium]|nr:LON peptidase substrate-binding domain-containing protein [Maricaulaceae bacterium]
MTKTLPSALPLFPLPGAILLPGETLPLNVFEPRYLNMVDDALAGARLIGVVQTRDGGTAERPTLEAIGGAGRIVSHRETPDGRYLIELEGVSRFRILEELPGALPYRVSEVDYEPFAADRAPPDALLGEDREGLTRLLQGWFSAEKIEADWESLTAAPLARVVGRVAMAAPFAAKEKQALLEAEDERARLALMAEILSRKLAEGAGGPAN